MTKFGFGIFGLALVALVTTSGAYAKKSVKRQVTAPKLATVTPTGYRSAWSRVASCEQFRSQLWLLPQADSLLQPAASSNLAVKSEFESKTDFAGRVTPALAPFLDADRVYLIHALNKWSSYDPERREMTVSFPSYTKDGHIPVGFNVIWTTTKGATYSATNAFGVSKAVQRQARTAVNVEYDFPTAVTGRPIKFPMNSSDAQMFKMGIGEMHILGRVTSTHILRGRASPTIERPTDTNYVHYEVSIEPRCAYITFASELIEGWSYEAWDGSAPRRPVDEDGTFQTTHGR